MDAATLEALPADPACAPFAVGRAGRSATALPPAAHRHRPTATAARRSGGQAIGVAPVSTGTNSMRSELISSTPSLAAASSIPPGMYQVVPAGQT